MKQYFNSIDALSNYAGNYPASGFALENKPCKCGCDSYRVAYEVTDRQDNDILEILVICPLCANLPKIAIV